MATFFKDNTGVLVRDQNRYRKIYRYIRKKPRPLLCGSDEISHFQWGTFFVDFDNQSSVTHYFPCCYTSAPVVVGTAVENGGTTGNYNTFISSITSEYAVFETSGLYTGRIHYQALIEGVYTMPNIGKNMEVKELTFNSTNYMTYAWTTTFNCVPVVTATANEDVNVFVSAVSTSEVTVEVSQINYTGKVYIVGIERGC